MPRVAPHAGRCRGKSRSPAQKSSGPARRAAPLRAIGLLLGAFGLLFNDMATFAEEKSRLPTLHTNEQFVDDVTRPTDLDTDDTGRS